MERSAGGAARELWPGTKPLITELSCWRVETENKLLATVRYGRDGDGNPAVQIDGADKNVSDFIIYYLADPLNTRPVHIEGLGAQKGPHIRDQEVFDVAMSVMGHYFPAYRTVPV
jgi:hypothetical protein